MKDIFKYIVAGTAILAISKNWDAIGNAIKTCAIKTVAKVHELKCKSAEEKANN